jgi:hypothetical protein
MLASDYILPAQRAALYRFLAATPGLTVEPQVRDVSGRLGIGVVWHFYGSKAMKHLRSPHLCLPGHDHLG